MGYPPPPAGPPPPYPFAAGEDIARAEAARAFIAQLAKQKALAANQTATTNAFVASSDAATIATATFAKPFAGIGAFDGTGLAATALAALQAAMADPTPTNLAVAQATMTAVAAAQNTAVETATAAMDESPVEQAITNALNAEATVVEDAMQAAAILGEAMRALSIAKQDLAMLPVIAQQEAQALAAQTLAAGELMIAEAAGATPAEAQQIIAGLSLLCQVFEAGLSAEFGGDLGLSLALALTAGASVGVSATCCGFSLNLSLGFLINFQLPPAITSAIAAILILLPYLGFSLSCDPTKPPSLIAGVPWGGGRQPNAPPDPDLNEDSD